MNPHRPVSLGAKVRDRVTGLEGIVVAMSQYLDGCDRVGVQPIITKDANHMPAQEWFDITRVSVIGKGVEVFKPEVSARTGGPQIDPPRRGMLAGLLILTSAAFTLGGCYVQDRTSPPDTSHHPTGGKLPADLAVDAQFGRSVDGTPYRLGVQHGYGGQP